MGEQEILRRLGARLCKGGLRVQGRLPDSPGVAVVGSRRASSYGLELAGRIAREVVERGGHVVSGGAYGIDAAAHRGALDAGGETVVVLGSGLDCPTPRAHLSLFERARAQGAVVSPFPCGTRAQAWTFPRRNPHIARLAESVVVVQATRRSGALHTARAALRQDKPVFVVPGGFENPLHTGCHLLVGEGASLYVSTKPASVEAEPPADARAVWQAAFEPATLEELASRAGLSISQAALQATDLELGGWLVAEPGGRFRRTRSGA